MLSAINAALDRLPGSPVAVPTSMVGAGVVPGRLDALGTDAAHRVSLDGGQNKASADDRKHYHLLVETVDGAARLNLNGDAIGTTMCGMAGAQESPFKASSAPINRSPWDLLVDAHVDLCRRYDDAGGQAAGQVGCGAAALGNPMVAAVSMAWDRDQQERLMQLIERLVLAHEAQTRHLAGIHESQDAMANKQQAELQERIDELLEKMEKMPAPQRRQ